MPKRQPIAEQLATTAGGKWTAVRDGFGWLYRSDDGRTVRRYSEARLGYDGYSDTEFNTVYIDDRGNRLLVGTILRL